MNSKRKRVIIAAVSIVVALLLFWAVMIYMKSLREQDSKKTEFIDITRNIELELYAMADGENQLLTLLQYLRSGRDTYTTEEWNLLCGSLDEETAEALNEKDVLGSFAALRQSDTYDDPTGLNGTDSLDFIHLCATLNVAFGSFSVMEDGQKLVQQAGWIGDILQAVSASEDISLFGSDTGSMNIADMTADIDAANLLTSIQQCPNDKFYIILQNYYLNQTDFERNNAFFETYYPQAKTGEEKATAMYEAVMDETSPVLEALCQSLNINRSEKSAQIQEACTKLAELLTTP